MMSEREAFEGLLRQLGSQEWMALTFGLSPEHISRIKRGRVPVPKYMVLIWELLRAMPMQDWPARWQPKPKKTHDE